MMASESERYDKHKEEILEVLEELPTKSPQQLTDYDTKMPSEAVHFIGSDVSPVRYVDFAAMRYFLVVLNYFNLAFFPYVV